MAMRKELLDIAGRGNVLVFPTEEASRAFSVSYALAAGKGLLASSALAFDKFASLFYPHPSGKTPAGEMDRTLFSSYAATGLSGKLRYFSTQGFPEIRERLQPYFKSMLQHLEEAEGANAQARADMALLLAQYKTFLEKSSLYENAYSSPVMPVLDREYYLVYPAAFPKERQLASFLRGREHIHMQEAESVLPGLSVHRSEIEEIREVFLHIRQLADEGVRLSDIVIATAADGRLRCHLLEEAYSFSIPVEFVAGSSPLAFPAGAFFSSLEEIYRSQYSLSALKEFFLNPAFPFKDRERLRLFIRASVDASITSAPSRESDRYRRIPESAGGDLYRLLRFALDLLMTEKDPDRILPLVNQITMGLLEKGEFSAEEDREVYSFAMNELTAFLKKLKASALQGFPAGGAVFPLFLRYLENIRYVPREKKGGVRIYSFSDDAALYAPYRFILTLNERESKKVVKEASYLSDYEIEGEREERDITFMLLNCYSVFSGKLFLSASYETYAGYALPLMGLRQEVPGRLPDAWRMEESRNIFPLQKESYEKALKTSLRKVDEEKDLTRAMPGKPYGSKPSLSYSTLHDYETCPFMHALKYRYGFKDEVLYSVPDLDVLEIGNRLHSVMERFFSAPGDPEILVKELFEDEMRLWAEGKRYNKGTLEDMPSYALRATDAIIAWVRRRYLDKVIDLARTLSEGYEPLPEGIEAEYSDVQVAGRTFSLQGRVDLIATNRNTDALALIDYKTTLPENAIVIKSKALQFHVYSLILSLSEGMEAGEARFAGFNNGKTKEVPVAGGALREELLERLSAAAHGIETGDWRAKVSKESCEGCRFRAICRKRFTVR